MKNLILGFCAILFCDVAIGQVEYKIITSVESIVPMGIGRSRLLDSQQEVNHNDLTTERTEGKKSDMGSVKRKNIKIDHLEETKLLNFYSVVGINFQNIASNDAVVASKLNEMSNEGWELFQVVSGVESDAGGDDGSGIYITRYIFRRNK